MPVEPKYEYIDDLQPSYPTGSENLNEGDEHVRGTKSAVKGSFPQLGQAAVNATAAELQAAAKLKSGYGGMTLALSGTVITVPPNTQWLTLTPVGATTYGGTYVTMNPSNGRLTVTGLTATNRVRLNGVVTMRRNDAVAVPSGQNMRFRVLRNSNQVLINGTLVLSDIPDQNDTVTYPLISLDFSPAASGEGFEIQVAQGYTSSLDFTLFNYNFWIEPIGE